MSVPTSSGSAPNTSPDTSQLLVKVKPKTPNCWNASDDSSASFRKKYAISARIAAERAVSPQRRTLSGRRASRNRPSSGRLRLADTEPASNSAADRRAVAGEAISRRCRLLEQRSRELRVLELAQHALPLAEAVVDEALHRLGLALVEAALAEVLVDDHERLRRDRVGLRVGR